MGTSVQCFGLRVEFLPRCRLLAAVLPGSDPELLLKTLPKASSSCAELISIFSKTVICLVAIVVSHLKKKLMGFYLPREPSLIKMQPIARLSPGTPLLGTTMAYVVGS